MEIFGYYLSWELLGTLLLLLIDVVLLFISIFKRKVNVFDGTKEFIMEHLPTCIVLSEKIGQTGSEKKSACVSLMYDLMRKAGIDDVEYYEAFIKQNIESILCTPQKKGVKI